VNEHGGRLGFGAFAPCFPWFFIILFFIPFFISGRIRFDSTLNHEEYGGRDGRRDQESDDGLHMW